MHSNNPYRCYDSLSFGPKSPAISRNCSSAASRSSTISWREDIGIGKIIGFFEAFVSEPEDIEAGFVAVDEFVIVVGSPAAVGTLFGPSRRSLIAILGIVALNELVEVFALQGIGLECEVFVGSEIVDPELLGPWRFACRFLVEEKNVRFHALGIEQPFGRRRSV